MNSELRNKKFGLKRFLFSLKNSINGLKYAYFNEQSMFIHLLATILSVLLGILLKISFIEWIIIISLLVVIAIVELVNTAIEAVCDAVSLEYNELIKISKDTASSAVFISCIIGLIVGFSIFIPKIIEVIEWKVDL